MGQDEPQLLLARHECDLAGVRSMAATRSSPWTCPGGMAPERTGATSARASSTRHPAGQRVKRGVLGSGQHRLQRVQVRLADQQPDQRQDVRVDAQPGQVGVADVSE